ncbi:uncharacterized protein GGS22DRAFT_148656 [Annulohypoxylon maeteangense]|uniref:uncharacterized protein n=1 Tax=Annulohypoxylon maeteangense TaxID=1927788 RepID=UPI002007A2FD|nr:uncharacterized protein GGS22DRAFT_148656 [Annulohypoxylon maeteangense]KAI0889585.1 hypothetical protein GGS22DRAFT_148656 [Annulohypoxylon maeteangense]
MSDSADPKTNNNTKPCDEADLTSDKPETTENEQEETDPQTAYAEQFDEEEEEHWADSYGDGDEQPPSRGALHMGTVKTTVPPKPPPKNNP